MLCSDSGTQAKLTREDYEVRDVSLGHEVGLCRCAL